jgi:hypothetical protein
LQSLCLPTDDIDPDAQSYERSEKVVVDTKALATAIAQAADIETLAKIGQYITSNKDHIEPTILETLRLSFKEAQSKVAVAVVETPKAVDEPINA